MAQRKRFRVRDFEWSMCFRSFSRQITAISLRSHHRGLSYPLYLPNSCSKAAQRTDHQSIFCRHDTRRAKPNRCYAPLTSER